MTASGRCILAGLVVLVVLGVIAFASRFWTGAPAKVKVAGPPPFAIIVRNAPKSVLVGPVVPENTEYDRVYTKHSSRRIDDQTYEVAQVFLGKGFEGGEQLIEVADRYVPGPKPSAHVRIRSKVPLLVLVRIPEGAVYEEQSNKGSVKALKNMKIPPGTYDWIIRPAEAR